MSSIEEKMKYVLFFLLSYSLGEFLLVQACGPDNKSILKSVLHSLKPDVKAKFKDVFVEAFETIRSVVPVVELREKCGGKCANFLISALAIVLSHACEGAERCKEVTGPAALLCLEDVYLTTNQSIENMEPVAITCFQTVQIGVTPEQSRCIATAMVNAINNAVRPRPLNEDQGTIYSDNGGGKNNGSDVIGDHPAIL